MNKQKTSIDLAKLAMYVLKRIWLPILCAAIGFGFMYWRSSKAPDTYTATGTMFVSTNNPNLVNYGYASSSDFSTAVQLVNIYSEVIKSEVVTQDILGYRLQTVERDGVEQDLLLGQKYPGMTTGTIRGAITMNSVNETPMVRINCTTGNPEMSKDICEAVLQIAPKALKDVVGAGDATALEFPTVPRFANARQDRQQGLIGALAGAVAALALLVVLFLLNRRVEDEKELTEKYTPPVLSSVRRHPGNEKDPGSFLLGPQSDLDVAENYAKLRMNLLFTLTGKETPTVLITSAVSGEGKSTVAANLAISLAMSGKKVLLVDADMRRACQRDIFHYEDYLPGLSDMLAGNAEAVEAILPTVRENLDILPSGSIPPNPSELLESAMMQELLEKLEAQYDMVLLDAPPVNIVSDPLALSKLAKGAVFVVRQHFSDHREIRKALISAEMTGLEVLGFVFYGEKIRQGSYSGRKAYPGYKDYHRYDTRNASMKKAPGKAGTENTEAPLREAEEESHEKDVQAETADSDPAGSVHARRRGNSGK